MESAYSKSVDTLLACWEQFSLKGRKGLATKTKEIKSIAPGERLAFMKSLLKLYQEEIDHLTVRSQ